MRPAAPEPDLAWFRLSGTAAVVPVLVYRDVAAAADFLCAAFGFSELARYPCGGADVVRAELAYRGESVVLACESAMFRRPRPYEVTQYILIAVPDIDAHWTRARSAGVDVVGPPVVRPTGAREYSAFDPGRHRWTFMQHPPCSTPSEPPGV